MYLFLIGLILLQTIIISLKKKNMPLIILGGCAAILIGIFGSLQIRLGIWGVFFVTHILLMLLYSLESQKQFQKESVAYQIVRKYTDIPTYFYTSPLGTLFVALVIVGKDSEGFMPIIVISVITLFCMIYNCSVNNMLKKEIEIGSSQISILFDKKDALFFVFTIMQSLSVGMLYSGALTQLDEKVIAILFIVELCIHLLIFFQNYNKGEKIKSDILGLSKVNYPKWQLFVPKKVGFGLTLNFSCPLTYAILAILVVGIIVILIYS